MKLNFAHLAFVAAVQLGTSAPSEACGIKLVTKTSTPRKAVVRSSNPSRMLLLGTPPHRLERELSAAGHDVETAPNAASAKRSSYNVVVVDQAHADEAAKFAGATIIVRSDDVTADLSSIERNVARQPVGAIARNDPKNALEKRQPLAAGPVQPKHEIVASKDPTAVDPVPPTKIPKETPKETPKVAVVPPKEVPKETPKETPRDKIVAVHEEPKHVDKVAPKVVEPKVVEPRVAKTPDATFRDEFYFGLGSASVANQATLARAVKWMNASPSVQVVVEGYADPTGSPDANMTLSQTRAESVKDLLVKAGIDASRIEVTAFGDTKLKYGATDGRNRRVAITPKP